MIIAVGILLALSLQGGTALILNNIEQCLYRPLNLIGNIQISADTLDR